HRGHPSHEHISASQTHGISSPALSTTGYHARSTKASRPPQRPGHLRAGRQQRPPGAGPLRRLTRHLRSRRRNLHGPLGTRQRNRHRAPPSRRNQPHQHNPLHRKNVLPPRLHRRNPRPLPALHRKHSLSRRPRPRRKETLLEDPPSLEHRPP